jgi:glycosyltransferase involved in cell wall biosynthesis
VAAEGGNYILFSGRLSEEKGLLTLLSAIRKAKVPLLIAGEGSMRPDMEHIIANTGLTHVQMMGYLTGPALTQAVAGARLIVVPSEWYEVFGQVIIEAFAQGKPVVATAIGGIPEVVSNGIDGLLVPPGDADALASAMQWLWERPQAATEMGQAGRAKVKAQYDAPTHYQRILALYQEVQNQTPN